MKKAIILGCLYFVSTTLNAQTDKVSEEEWWQVRNDIRFISEEIYKTNQNFILYGKYCDGRLHQKMGLTNKYMEWEWAKAQEVTIKQYFGQMVLFIRTPFNQSKLTLDAGGGHRFVFYKYDGNKYEFDPGSIEIRVPEDKNIQQSILKKVQNLVRVCQKS